MKKFINIFCAAAAIVALASCAKDNLGSKVKAGSEKTFTAGLSTPVRTTADADYKTYWAAGDRIMVFNSLEDSESVTVPASAAGKSATTITTTSISDADAYYAVYSGAGSESYMDGSDICIAISDQQTGAWGDAQVAAAIAADGVFAFKNISSLIEFEVSANVKSVDFSSTGKFPYEVYVSFPEGTPVIETTSTTDQIAVNTGNAAGKFYLAAFPCEIPQMSITINYASESKSIVIDTPIALAAGGVLQLGDIESRAGKTFKVASKVGFTEVSGNIDEGGNFTYTANKGGAGTPPGIYNNGIRIYQGNPGGNIEIVSAGGDKIRGIKITTTNTYNSLIVVKADSDPYNVKDTVFVKKNTTKGFSGLNANKVTIYTYGTSSSQRAEICAISVTYEADPRIAQELSFPQAAYSVKVGETFTAPTVSGAVTTVTYSSSDTDVATVDAATGAVTIKGAGKCDITATAAATQEYKAGVASYELTVAAGATGVDGIKSILRAGGSTETDFVADVTDMVISYLKDDAYPHIAYAQDAAGDAVYFYFGNESLPFKEGDKINGSVSGTGKVYSGCAEITSFNVSGATVTSGSTIAPVEVTIETLLANYADYEYRKCKIVDATVTVASTESVQSGTISQNGSSITLRQGQKGFAITNKGDICDFIVFPDYYNTDKQAMIWSQSQVISKGGANTIEIAAEKVIAIGDSWTIGATCKSGSVTYQITEGSQYITLSNGVVTGVAAGTAKIKATSPTSGAFIGQEAICTITVTGADEKTLKYAFDYKAFPDGFTATTGTSGDFSVKEESEGAGTLTVNYSGINTKSSATAKDHAYGYAMFLKNYGYIYSGAAISGFYPSKVECTFSSGTGETGKVGATFGDSALSSRNSSVSGSVVKSGSYTGTNTDPTKTFWNLSTTNANVQIVSITVTYSKIAK